MIITDPTQAVMKICRMCGTEFQSPRYYGKMYCTPKCRRRAKNLRESGRTPAEVVKQMLFDERYFKIVDNPTNVQLDVYAQLILKEMTDDKPIAFTNLSIMWKPPEGIIWLNPPKLNDNDPDLWVMYHPSMGDDL